MLQAHILEMESTAAENSRGSIRAQSCKCSLILLASIAVVDGGKRIAVSVDFASGHHFIVF